MIRVVVVVVDDDDEGISRKYVLASNVHTYVLTDSIQIVCIMAMASQ